MLQQAERHLIVSESSEDLIASEPWSIDTYADGLMDELFADIDQILDGTFNLPAYTVKAEHVTLETGTKPQISLPNSVAEVPHLRNQPLNRGGVDNRSVKPFSKKRQKTRLAWRKLLIWGTTFSLAIAGVIYLVNSKVFNSLSLRLSQQSIQAPQSKPHPPTKADIEAELVNYMLGALAVIDEEDIKNHRQSAKPGLAVSATPNQTSLAFANDATAGSLPAMPNRSSNVVERIYIPVYQAPSPMRYTPPVMGATPKPIVAPSAGNAVGSALNTVQKAPKPVSVNMLAAAVRTDIKPVTVKTAPIAVRQSPHLLPTLPVVPFHAAPPKLPAVTALATQQQASLPISPIAAAPAPSHILEGLLELGGKSAALFNFDGVTHRVNVGESIGSSGWILVEVSNGEAIVRRNGEVRSIYTGQKL